MFAQTVIYTDVKYYRSEKPNFFFTKNLLHLSLPA